MVTEYFHFLSILDVELLTILANLVPNLEVLTYHYNYCVDLLPNRNANQSVFSMQIPLMSEPWSRFRNLSKLGLTNIMGNVLIEGVLKVIGSQLLDLTINNVGLWDYMNIHHHQSYQTPHRILNIREERVNLFKLGVFAPNLKRLCLEMGHYIFDHRIHENMLQNVQLNSSFDTCECDNGIVRTEFSEFLKSLSVLHIKGINSTSSEAIKQMLCLCQNLEELILLTKPPCYGRLRQRFRAESEYELCSIMNDRMLMEILRKNPMKYLRTFIASTVNPCPSGCRLQLSDNR